MADAKHDTAAHDMTPGVIEAVKTLDMTTLSYVQLRRLRTALANTSNAVNEEIAKRSGADNLGETVRIQTPKKPPGA